MKLINFKLVALFIVSYCLALAVLTPLQWILPIIEPYTKGAGISLNDASGTIWSGKLTVNEKMIGKTQVQWKFQPSGLFLMKAPFDISIQNPNMTLSAIVDIKPLGFSINSLEGFIDEKAFKSAYSAYRIDISGRLRLNEINADMSWSKELGSASGLLSWSGGPIEIPVGRSTQNYKVPMLSGVIDSNEDEWFVQINGDKKQDYIRATLTRSGMGTLSLKRQLATDMKIAVPGSGSSLFDISQQVL